MTDIVKLCINANSILNGASATSATPLGTHASMTPEINSNIPVSGVNGVTTNGYLDDRFME